MFGLFSPESKSSKETNITTNTTTTMRDVGLTGRNAVDMAAVLSTGNIETTRITAATLDNLIQQSGNTAQQLIGGASGLVRTSGETLHAVSDIAQTQAAMAGQGGTDLMKIAPYVVVAIIAFFALTMKRRK